jgi:hypothetical protein
VNDSDGESSTHVCGLSSQCPGVWTSVDGLEWDQAALPDGNAGVKVRDVTIGGPGLVAVGDDWGSGSVRAAVWLSSDGREWERVHDSGFDPGRMWLVGATDQGLVAFGDDCLCIHGNEQRVIWTSTDGREWLRATNESGLEVAQGVRALVRSGSELTAFVPRGPGGIDVWRTAGRADWQKVANLRGDIIDFVSAAHGPRGWVAAAEGGAWWSVDGVAWHESLNAPDAIELIADDAGFVAVGMTSTSTGCAEPDGAFIGHTWTSSDGRVWREIEPRKAWDGDAVAKLLVDGRTLIGVGQSFSDRTRPGVTAVWTAPLPPVSGDAGSPPPAPTPTPKYAGCGEP